MTQEKLLVKRDGDFHYPICFEQSFDALADVLREEGLEGRKLCIVTDTNVAPLYLETVKKALAETSQEISEFVFPAGEASKNLQTAERLYKTLIENELDRKSLLVALGGGVVGDLTGFAAATYLRGIDFVQVPTTLFGTGGQQCGRQNPAWIFCATKIWWEHFISPAWYI